MLLLRVLQATIIYGLSTFYAIHFLIKTALQFLANPNLSAWSTKEHSTAPTALDDPRYGTHRFIKVNGVTLHYVEKGDPGKPLMLFLHGFMDFWFSWRHQLEEFSKDYWTVALDLRGHGQSERLDDREAYQMDLIVEDIRSFVEALGRDRVIFVGHNLGSVLGFQFVAKHMDMVDRYVIMAAPSVDVIRQVIRSSWRQFRMSWYTFFYLMPRLPEVYLKMKDFGFIRDNMERFLTESELEAYKHTFSQAGALTRALNYYRENFRFLRKEDPLPKIVDYSPGLYLLAEHDRFISPQCGPAMCSSFRNLKHQVLPKCSHYMQQESPELINKLIRDFLNHTS